jgi:hypothetical protein
LKKIAIVYFLPLAFFVSNQSKANDNFTFGIGFGSMYSGMGVNAGIKSETDLKYISVGCVSYSTLSGEACGAGIGWVTTQLFSSNNTNHGTSIYAGIVGSENDHFNNDPVYGVGLGYHYFFNGIGDSGTTLGLTLVAGDENHGIGMGGMLQLGYQF